MPKKKGSAKGKKGSAKVKKGSAKEKKDPVEQGPPSLPELAWPWTQAALGWMGRSPGKKEKLRVHFRDHYVNSEAIVWSQAEWVRSLSAYAHPYDEAPDVEAMVQMLVTLLANEGTRKESPDNYRLFAAALR